MTERIKQAESLLKKDNAVCVVISLKNGILKSQKSGVMPLLDWLNQSPELLKGACAADRVVGKAAVLLMVYGGVAEVYAEVISDFASDYLQQNEVPFAYTQKVPYIQNRDKTGMCPLERRCASISSPREAYEALSEMMTAHP